MHENNKLSKIKIKDAADFKKNQIKHASKWILVDAQPNYCRCKKRWKEGDGGKLYQYFDLYSFSRLAAFLDECTYLSRHSLLST